MKRLIAIAMLLVACAREEPSTTTTTGEARKATPPPTADEARQIIQASMAFGEYEFTDASYTLPMTGSMMNDPQRAAVQDLARAEWLRVDNAGDVTLGEKGRTDKRFLVRENGLLDIVPLAKKEMGSVVAIRANEDGTVSADFTWQWVPNEVAIAFMRAKFEGTREAKATLIHDGTQWTVLKIEPR